MTKYILVTGTPYQDTIIRGDFNNLERAYASYERWNKKLEEDHKIFSNKFFSEIWEYEGSNFVKCVCRFETK
jgi:hypothetical protein